MGPGTLTSGRLIIDDARDHLPLFQTDRVSGPYGVALHRFLAGNHDVATENVLVVIGAVERHVPGSVRLAVRVYRERALRVFRQARHARDTRSPFRGNNLTPNSRLLILHQ